MTRRLVAPVALAALVAIGGCGLFRQTAATVNGSVITVDDLERELAWLQAVPEFRQAALGDAQVEGDVRGALSAQIVALGLNRIVVFRIVDQEVGRRGLNLTEADRRQALTDTVAQLTAVLGDEFRAVDVFNALPVDFKLALIDRQAKANVLQRSLPAGQPTLDQLRAFYEANRQRFEKVCARYVLSRTQEASRDALARVRRGEDFALVARELSVDPNAVQTGGDVGCFGRGGVEQTFSERAFETRLGEVAGPVEAPNVGWYLILVYDRQGDTFDRARDEVAKAFRESGPAIAFQSLIQGLLGDARVNVNPRYGHWDREQRRVVSPTVTERSR